MVAVDVDVDVAMNVCNGGEDYVVLLCLCSRRASVTKAQRCIE